eukprot:3358584-Rhodomonas_salina.1
METGAMYGASEEMRTSDSFVGWTELMSSKDTLYTISGEVFSARKNCNVPSLQNAYPLCSTPGPALHASAWKSCAALFTVGKQSQVMFGFE